MAESQYAPMRYTLASDLPGYLRVRFGALAFTDEEGWGISEALRQIEGVTEVRTSTANGSVLVRYEAAGSSSAPASSPRAGDSPLPVPEIRFCSSGAPDEQNRISGTSEGDEQNRISGTSEGDEQNRISGTGEGGEQNGISGTSEGGEQNRISGTRDTGDATRDAVLRLLGNLHRGDLPSAASPDDVQSSHELTSRFVTRASAKVGGHFLRKLLLPVPLRNIWTVATSLRFITRGLRALVGRGQLTVEVLDATAITAAMCQGMFSSAASVMLLLDISDMLEEYTHSRSRVALEQSLALNMGEVWLVTDDGPDVEVPLDAVGAGDCIRVRTGAMIPVDGEVTSGEAAVNEATMTGESRLVVKDAGSSVFAGTLVDDGSIVVRAREVGADTRVQGIVALVDESEKLKAGVQSKAERLADAIVPASFVAFFGVLALTRNMTKALSVLMVDYSCAIKLSTPVAVMSAMREAASRGIVVKGGRYLETIAEADTIVFDKTGTLTTATPTVKGIVALADMGERELLGLAACLEEHFPHSMARAVVAEARRRGISHDDEAHAEVTYLVAHGIASEVDGKHTVLGSAHYVFEDEGIAPPEGAAAEKLARASRGCSTIYLAIDGVLEGAICITDPLRDGAAATVAALREVGFEHVVMLTGDAEGAARAAASELGIDEWRAQVLPEDKSRIVGEYRDAGHTVVMVGDGVNDSPALAAADCSVAMVDASDVAREVADVTLLGSSLDEILTLRELGVSLMRRINRNYSIIVSFNSGLLAGGVAGLLQPTVSSVLHNGLTMLITAANMAPLLGEGAPDREDPR